MFVVGRRLFPWVLWQVTRTGSRELFTLCVVAAAVSIAYGSAELFGVSFALGAFLAGMVLTRVAIQPARGKRDTAAARCIRGAVFCRGGHVVRSASADRASVEGRRDRGDYRVRQFVHRSNIRDADALSTEHCCHGIGWFGADWGVFVHSGCAWFVARSVAAARTQLDPGRRTDLDRA